LTVKVIHQMMRRPVELSTGVTPVVTLFYFREELNYVNINSVYIKFVRYHFKVLYRRYTRISNHFICKQYFTHHV
jgi:hypothetical protein